MLQEFFTHSTQMLTETTHGRALSGFVLTVAIGIALLVACVPRQKREDYPLRYALTVLFAACLVATQLGST
tara:strand:+ start:82 stop:294 length:213 start_codon:yes stop_codon:yes gene_type:complete